MVTIQGVGHREAHAPTYRLSAPSPPGNCSLGKKKHIKPYLVQVPPSPDRLHPLQKMPSDANDGIIGMKHFLPQAAPAVRIGGG